ncbi:alkaline phosphatase [Marinitoga aeolica]|uniref:Alkaline phosphatase n=1 Tax=Marinitoga aeolica TaxID=2809031 RepID=A0ABY8PTW6_9BACT|nr:alkaline phosphatase [Marinitoga aeolica]WGS66080.1 alkaline phosphatase [Marinitoga aeolica]
MNEFYENSKYRSCNSANSNVTDSAAAGTALFSGFKTNNGMIGMLPDGTIVPTIAEIAAQNGVKIGVYPHQELRMLHQELYMDMYQHEKMEKI